MNETFGVSSETPPSQPTVITARGELDADSAPQVDEAINAATAAGASLVLLDLKAVEFLDSSGLRVIVAAGARLKATGGQLLITGMSAAAHRVLEIAGLLDEYAHRAAADGAPAGEAV